MISTSSFCDWQVPYCVRIFCLDSIGNQKWSFKKNDPDFPVFSGNQNVLIKTKDGNYLMGGANFHNEPPDDAQVVLVKVDSTGKELWTRYYDGEYIDWVRSIIELPSGNLMLYIDGNPGGFEFQVGDSPRFRTYYIKIDPDGNKLLENTIETSFPLPQLNRELGGNTILHSNGYLYNWHYGLPSVVTGNHAICLSKVDTNGINHWTKYFQGVEYDGISIFEQPGGNLICTEVVDTTFSPQLPGFGCCGIMGLLYSFDTSGTLNWKKQLFLYKDDGYLWDHDFLPNGDMIGIGKLYSYEIKDFIPWLYKTDKNGSLLWQRFYIPKHGQYQNGYSRLEFVDVECMHDGRVAIAGHYYDTIPGNYLSQAMLLVLDFLRKLPDIDFKVVNSSKEVKTKAKPFSSVAISS